MKLSGYTTTRNTVLMDYPMKESIQSLLDFCDEVVVMDSSDGKDSTKDVLSDLKKQNSNLKLYTASVDWNAPNHGIYDGALKQAAREKCTGDFLWQSDVDEIVLKEDRQKLEELLKQTNYLNDVPVLCLPVVEYWGSYDKVRIDVNPWKWRVSRNLPDITHGIPVTHRKYENNLLFAKHGTDGCDYISKSTGNPVQALNFMNQQIEQMRQMAFHNEEARKQYEMWFNHTASGLPTVYHYSWFSIKKKIQNYKMFWNDFWPALYNEQKMNMFFDIPWEQVTDEMIEQKASELKEKTGGHVFHQPWTGQATPSVKIQNKEIEIMKDWCLKHPL
jgi:hypothetical protein